MTTPKVIKPFVPSTGPSLIPIPKNPVVATEPLFSPGPSTIPHATKSTIPLQPNPTTITPPPAPQVPKYHHLPAPNPQDVQWAQMTQTPENAAFHEALANSTAESTAIVNAVLKGIGNAIAPKAPTSIGAIIYDLTFLAPGPIKGLDAVIAGVKAARSTDEAIGLLQAIRDAYHEPGPVARIWKRNAPTPEAPVSVPPETAAVPPEHVATAPAPETPHWTDLMPAEAKLRAQQEALVHEVAPEAAPHEVPYVFDQLVKAKNPAAVALLRAQSIPRAPMGSVWTQLKSETGSLKLPEGEQPSLLHQTQLFDEPAMQQSLLPVNNGAGVTEYPTILSTAQARDIAKQIRGSGHQLPPSMNTLPKLTKVVQRLHATAVQGSAYRDWYARAAANMQEVARVTGVSVKQVAQLTAVYSQVRNPTENLKLVLRAIEEWQRTGTIVETKGGGEGSGLFQQKKAIDILNGKGWAGRKTNTFYQNQAKHIPELQGEVANPEGVTVDRHATNLLAPELKGSPGVHYSGLEHTYQAVAHELGWTPDEVQAASWVVFKADQLQRQFPRWSRARALREAGDAYEKGVAKHLHGIGKQQAIDLESVDKINANIQTAQDIIRETDYSGLDVGIKDIHEGSGGHTWTANLASDTAKDGYYVSNGKAELVIPKAEATADRIRNYRDAHADELAADPTLRVGAWGTEESGQPVVYLDLTHHINDRLSALRLGLKAKQQTIWDIKAGKEIPIVSSPMHEVNPAGAYERLLHANAVHQGWHKGEKPLSKINRTASEAYLHEWAAANPDHPATAQLHDLYLRAHGATQTAEFPKGASEVQSALDQNMGSDLSGLPGEVNVPGLGKIAFHSNADLQRIARQFAHTSAPRDYVHVDPARAEHIAQWYDEAIHAPTDPAVTDSYDAFIQETKAQYDTLVAEGYTFDFYPEGRDPYPNGPREAVIDASTNKHLYVYPTESGFGDGATLDHPLLADSGEVWSGKPVTHNDLFRGVHDLFGHVKEGVGFRADGEENAWRQHSAMYSEAARPAMTSETRGQNSWVNYGPHGEANQTAKQDATVYADQKAVLAPDWVVNDGATDAKGGLRAHLADETGSLDLGSVKDAALRASDVVSAPFRSFRDKALERHPGNLKEIGPEGRDRLDQWLERFFKDERGSADVSHITDRPHRYAKYGSMRTQFPLSQSIITGEAQRTLDLAGEKLSPIVDELRQSESATKRAVGKALTPASSRGRVAKMAGKNMRQEVKRAQSQLAHHAKTIHDAGHTIIPKIKHGGAEFAHWWYGQLPEEYRNAKGLQLARDKVNENLEYVKSGHMASDLEADLAEAQDALKEARANGEDVFGHMQTIGQIKAAQRDLPRLMRDLTINVAKFDKVLASPPEVNHSLLASMHALSKDAEDIYIAAGKLHPEQAENRKQIVSKWLGLEPSGEEFYVGHRMGKTRGAYSAFPGVGLGKVKTPQSLTHMNTLRLIGSGRARHDLAHLVEDWQVARSYEFANRMRVELGQLGKPFEGHVPRGYNLINPRGQKVDRKWKMDVQEQAKAEGFHPEDVHAQDLIDYMHNVIASGTGEQKAMIEHAMEHGYAASLRIVPSDVVSKYVGQWKNPTILAGTPGLANALRLTGKTIDNVNNAIYTSLIYANPGYIPANFLQNLIMAAAHQGAFLPSNLVRAGQIMSQAPVDLRNMILAEVGEGASVSAASGAGRFRSFAGHVQTIADNPSRISAFVHEMARLGVISKTKLYLGESDWKAIRDFMTNPANRAKLNDAKDRAVQSQVDFERLGPNERAVAKKIMFVWGWMRGATRYPGRFALDHPLRTAAGAYVIAGAPGAPSGVRKDIRGAFPTIAGGMPPYLEGAISAGHETIAGKRYPRVFPTRAISPISTPVDVLNSALNQPGSQSLGQMFNPGLIAGWDIANHQSPFGKKESYHQSIVDAMARTAPDVSLAQDLIHPPKPGSTMYPSDSSRLGRIERASRVWPVAVDPERAFRAKVLAGEVDTYHSAIHNLVRDSEAAGMGEPPRAVLEDLRWYTELAKLTRKDVDTSGRLDYLKASASTAKLYAERYGDQSVISQAASLATQGEAKKFYEILRTQLYPEYGQWKTITDRRLAIVKAQQGAG